MKTQELSLDLTPAELAFERACQADPDPGPDAPTGPAAPSAVGRGGPRLSNWLRGLGGLVIVAAFLLYLFQGWRASDDLMRCLLLIGHTGLLTLAGFASGRLLHEAKGARLFIALALAAVPVNFAFLGGLIYDPLTWDAPRAVDAAASVWQTAGGLPAGSALWMTAASLLGLALAVWVGFLIMARRSAGALTGLYLLANAALLIPTRDEAVVSVILLGLGLLLGGLTLSLRRRDPALATPEGGFARAVLVLPLLILGGRSVWLYAPDTLFFATLSLVGYLGLRQTIRATAPRWRAPLETTALLVAGLSTYLVFATLLETAGLADVLKVPLAVALLAGLLIDLSRFGSRWSTLYRAVAVLVAALAMALNLAAFGGFGNALACLALGVATLIYGYTAKDRLIFAVGLITALTGLGYAAQGVLAAFTIGGWSALVLLGIATIVAGSVVERHGTRLKAGLSRWNRHFE